MGAGLNARRSVRCAATGVLLVFGVAGARPAAAQVTFGSSGDPPRVALGGGAFDVLPDAMKQGHGTTGLVLGEYRFGDVLWILSPFVGAMGTGKGAVYTYLGFGFDINFPWNFVFTPSFSGGYFYGGHGVNLGSWWEFRSGAELDYRLAGNRRLGAGFYHISNAGLGKNDPGTEMATIVMTTPF
jgi:lipid A 3-O-deacylase